MEKEVLEFSIIFLLTFKFPFNHLFYVLIKVRFFDPWGPQIPIA